jgi:hypothetical protein
MVNEHNEIISYDELECFRDRGNLKNCLELNHDMANGMIRFQFM